MEFKKWKEVGCALAAAAALAGLVLFSAPTWGRVVLGLTVAVGFIGWQAAFSRRHSADSNRQIVGLLNRHRHDWMNDLQVLFGYVQLKKFDKLPDQMDKIRAKALFDGYLSKLGIPELVVYLFAFRAGAKAPALEVDLEQELDLRELQMSGYAVYKLIRGIIERFADGASGALEEETGTLSIGFDREEEELLLDFIYRGAADTAVLREELRKFLRKFADSFEIREEEYGEDKAVLALALPFRI